MSHWTICKVKIKNPDINLLKQALQVIAEELGVNQVVENMVVRGWHGKRKCLYAIPMALPYGNGYGVYIDKNGEVKVVVDDHGAPLSASTFANKLLQYYTALAVASASQQLGFNVQNFQQTREGVLIELVR